MLKADTAMLREALARQGQRFTRQRARVYEVLCATDRHPTAEEVYVKVKRELPSVSLATVYKSLDALVQCGLAQKLTYGDGSARFDANIKHHPHLRDLETGQVLDVPMELADRVALRLPDDVIAGIQKMSGFEVTGLRVELVGRRVPAGVS
ncbi:MAG: Peroxide-responsive repressor PerR [Phycisphaerae bacterium]|nr:Peroxide-responsive repressor PerR [Phycisphaerae bacterium]